MIRFCALAVVLAVSAPSVLHAGDASDVRAMIAASQKIPTGGLDELKAVKIGGIEQWISVRGNDASNPVLLFIHGGPGFPMMPLAWAFQRPWEEFFTVVQWDQRGTGKTFAAGNRQPDASMNLDRMQSDAEEMIAWLRTTYHQDKIFVMAHSFGSIAGLRIAQHHPEWLHAYIGVGQVINGRRNEEVSYRETMGLAEKAGDATAIAELKSIAPYPGTGQSTPLESVFLERKWVMNSGGMFFGKKSDDSSPLVVFSPLYSDSDAAAVEPGAMMSVQALVPESVDVNFDSVTTFKCPVFFFAGADDRTTPTTIVQDYYKRVRAPKKGLFVVKNAAHFVMMEAPGEMLVDLVRDVRPLAVKAH